MSSESHRVHPRVFLQIYHSLTVFQYVHALAVPTSPLLILPMKDIPIVFFSEKYLLPLVCPLCYMIRVSRCYYSSNPRYTQIIQFLQPKVSTQA